MKKLVLLIIVLILAFFVGYKLFFNKEKANTENKNQSLAISKNSDAVNARFFNLMEDYYAVKDALVEWDTARANKAALVLETYTDSLPWKEMKADSSIIATAENFASSINGDARGLIQESTIEQKRRSFNMITDEVYNLIRSVRYDGSVVYHVRCPMAFNDSEEAYWLSNSSHIVNPYLGKKHPKYNNKMIGCGEIVDSVDFVKK
jgi:hypothetical protein